MKYLFLLLTIGIILPLKGQGVVSVPILERMQATEMGLAAEDRASQEKRHLEQMLKYSEQVKLTTEQVDNAKERLAIVKEGVEKLKNINTKINNIKALERALEQQKYMIQRSEAFMQEVKQRGILSIQMTTEAFSTLEGLLSTTSYTISILSMVLTSDTEMNDYGRLSLMKDFVDQLNDDILLMETAMYEIKRIENSTMNSNTVKYMQGFFSTYND